MGCGASVEGEDHASQGNTRPAAGASSKAAPATAGLQQQESTDSKYKDDDGSQSLSGSGRRSSRDSHLSAEETAQIEAVRRRRLSARRPCSLAPDDSMRHYRLVTGNQRDDDEYFDGTRIKLRASSTPNRFNPDGSVSSSEDGASPLSRKSSIRRGSVSSSSNGGSSLRMKKSVSFTNSGSKPWRPCVK